MGLLQSTIFSFHLYHSFIQAYNFLTKMLRKIFASHIKVHRSRSRKSVNSSKKGDDESTQGSHSSTELKPLKAATVLMAYLGFKQPEKKRREYLIPKDKAAWLEYLVHLVKKKTTIEYLSEKELRKVIIRARPNLAGKKPIYRADPDAPVCINWTAHQTAEWISEVGFPFLKEAFLANQITGKRLITIDCSALNKIGMTDFSLMQKVTAKIRELLQIPKPNMLRALMRIPPFETYLKNRVLSGKTYDTLTFEKFCKQEGFNYQLFKHNKNALIPCTCEVRIVPNGVIDDDEEDLADDEDAELSLLNAPTVEFIVRNLVVRDKTVAELIEDIMESVFGSPESRKYGKPIVDSFKEALDRAYNALGGMTSQERLEFATIVSSALLEELKRTTEILNDITTLQKYINEKISPEHVKHLRECAEEFIESVLPIASLLAFGELDLETIFKQDPVVEKYIADIIDEAETTTNAQVPEALEFVDSVINLAKKKVKEMELPGLSLTSISSIKDLVEEVLDDILDDAVSIGMRELEEFSVSTFGDVDENSEGEGQNKMEQTEFDDDGGANADPEAWWVGLDDNLDDDDAALQGADGKTDEEKKQSIKEKVNLHLGEGQHTVAMAHQIRTKHPNQQHQQKRTQMTVTGKVPESSGAREPSAHSNASHPSSATPTRRLSAASILSKHSEQGDQPLKPGSSQDKNREKELMERQNQIHAILRREKAERLAHLAKPNIVQSSAKLVLENGKILGANGKVIGLTGPNFSILAEDGKTVIGFVDKTGTAFANEGTMIGKFEIKSKRKMTIVQQLTRNGNQQQRIFSPDGQLVATIEVDGRVFSNTGLLIGRIDPSGTIVKPDGTVAGIQGDIIGRKGVHVASFKSGQVVMLHGQQLPEVQSVKAPEQGGTGEVRVSGDMEIGNSSRKNLRGVSANKTPTGGRKSRVVFALETETNDVALASLTAINATAINNTAAARRKSREKITFSMDEDKKFPADPSAASEFVSELDQDQQQQHDSFDEQSDQPSDNNKAKQKLPRREKKDAKDASSSAPKSVSEGNISHTEPEHHDSDEEIFPVKKHSIGSILSRVRQNMETISETREKKQKAAVQKAATKPKPKPIDRSIKTVDEKRNSEEDYDDEFLPHDPLTESKTALVNELINWKEKEIPGEYQSNENRETEDQSFQGRKSAEIEEQQKKRLAQEKLKNLKKEWNAAEKDEVEKRRKLRLEREEAQRVENEKHKNKKLQEENAKNIWNEIQKQRRASEKHDSSDEKSESESINPNELENLMRTKKPTISHIETQHINAIKLKRKQQVEKWAMENEGRMNVSGETPEEQSRLVRITADQIVSEVIQLALTHMLLEAEAGKNTDRIMRTLKNIQRPEYTDDEDHEEHDVALWEPNLPRMKTATNVTKDIDYTKPTTKQTEAAKVTSHKTVTIDAPEEVKIEMKRVSQEALAIAIQKRSELMKSEKAAATAKMVNLLPPGKNENEHHEHHHHHRHSDNPDNPEAGHERKHSHHHSVDFQDDTEGGHHPIHTKSHHHHHDKNQHKKYPSIAEEDAEREMTRL